jgi:hypothetical protein
MPFTQNSRPARFVASITTRFPITIPRRTGLAVEGAGAGVGIFVAGAGLEATGNVVTRNRLTGNGLPGVAFHLHTALPGQNLSVAPITGIVIVQNVIKDEAVDIAANTPLLWRFTSTISSANRWAWTIWTTAPSMLRQIGGDARKGRARRAARRFPDRMSFQRRS